MLLNKSLLINKLFFIFQSYVSIRSGSFCNSSTRVSKVENGKVFPFEVSLDSEKGKMKNKQKPLKLGKKIYEFYGAPITKFWGHTASILLFLKLYKIMINCSLNASIIKNNLYIPKTTIKL